MGILLLIAGRLFATFRRSLNGTTPAMLRAHLRKPQFPVWISQVSILCMGGVVSVLFSGLMPLINYRTVWDFQRHLRSPRVTAGIKLFRWCKKYSQRCADGLCSLGL